MGVGISPVCVCRCSTNMCSMRTCRPSRRHTRLLVRRQHIIPLIIPPVTEPPLSRGGIQPGSSVRSLFGILFALVLSSSLLSSLLSYPLFSSSFHTTNILLNFNLSRRINQLASTSIAAATAQSPVSPGHRSACHIN